MKLTLIRVTIIHYHIHYLVYKKKIILFSCIKKQTFKQIDLAPMQCNVLELGLIKFCIVSVDHCHDHGVLILQTTNVEVTFYNTVRAVKNSQSNAES